MACTGGGIDGLHRAGGIGEGRLMAELAHPQRTAFGQCIVLLPTFAFSCAEVSGSVDDRAVLKIRGSVHVEGSALGS